MKNLVFTSVATTALLFGAATVNASDSFAPIAANKASSAISVAANGAKPGGMHMPRPGGMHMPKPGGVHMPRPGGMHMPKPGGVHMPRPGGMHMPRPNMPRPHMGGYHGPRGNWHGGHNAPGGYTSYRRPFRGFIMPSYWINPGFHVSNYSVYGLRAPTNGYNWSRYYDDAVLTDRRGYVYDSVGNVPWQSAPAYNTQPVYQQPVYAPTMNADRSVYLEDDMPVNASTEAGTYEGQWTGGYVDSQRQTYRGQWEGKYEGEDGRQYEGTYRGTAVGAPVYNSGTGANDSYGYTSGQPDEDEDYEPARSAPVNQGAPYQTPSYQAPSYQNAPYQSSDYRGSDGYSVPGGYETYERCLRSRGIAGGAIGAILGGVAGNRIAGRGNRLPGSIIGGGIGAIAGAGVERLANKCTKHLPRPQYRPATNYPPQQGYPQGYPQSYPQGYPQSAPSGYGWTQGYYYPQQPAATTTVTVVPGNMVTTTTTTEEVIYENVYTNVRPKGKALRRPAPTRKRCAC
jgi:Ni/Co efflux regulator RcnB